MGVREVTLIGTLTVSVLALIALGIQCLSCLLYIISFSTTGWGSVTFVTNTNYMNSGLWERCEDLPGQDHECYRLVGIEGLSGTYMASQAFAILGLFSASLGLASTVSYMFINKFKKDTRMTIALTVMSSLTVFMKMLCCILYGAAFNDEMSERWADENLHVHYAVSYSLGLTVFTILMDCVTAVCFVMEMRHARDLIPA